MVGLEISDIVLFQTKAEELLSPSDRRQRIRACLDVIDWYHFFGSAPITRHNWANVFSRGKSQCWKARERLWSRMLRRIRDWGFFPKMIPGFAIGDASWFIMTTNSYGKACGLLDWKDSLRVEDKIKKLKKVRRKNA